MQAVRNVSKAILAGVIFAAAGPAMRASAEEARYTFTLDGDPIQPATCAVDGTDDAPRPGDLVRIRDAFLLLGEERSCRFVREEEKLFLEGNGRRTLVWARTDEHYEGDNLIRKDPFPELTEQEARGLWGIHLEDPTKGEEGILRRIDPERCLVSLRAFARESVAVPSLPPALRCLSIDFVNGEGKRDYRQLLECGSLRFLAIKDQQEISLSALARCTKLRHLSLGYGKVTDLSALSSLKELRILNLSGCEGIEDVAFAKELKSLETLFIDQTSVRDLSPLAGHPALARIDLDRTPVEDLSPLATAPRLATISANQTGVAALTPSGFPALKSLEIMSTRVPAEESESFAKVHPGCRIRHGWEKALKEALAGIDRVRIRSGGTCHHEIDSEKTLAEVKDGAEIRAFLELIRIDEAGSDSSCRCCGTPTFEFYRSGKLVESVGFHHGRSLRWPGGWIGDGRLRPEASKPLIDWLAKRGVTGPLEARREEEARAKAEDQFIAYFPPGARSVIEGAAATIPGMEWEESAAAVWAQVAGEMNDPVAALVAACKALGSVRGSWSGRNYRQQIVLASAGMMDGEAFAAAIDRLKEERPALLGAARLAFAEGALAKMPEGSGTEPALRLAEVALTEGSAEDKRLVIHAIARRKDPRVAEFLHQVAIGRVGREAAKGSREAAKPGEPGIRACAWLALAEGGDRAVAAEAEKLLAGGTIERAEDRAALEICLALLGEAKFIKAEHFKIESGTLGQAALKAIERFGGREGMDVLIDAGLSHPYIAVKEEAVLVVQRLTGQEWFHGRQPERPSWYLKEVRAWWKENREKFLEEHRPPAK